MCGVKFKIKHIMCARAAGVPSRCVCCCCGLASTRHIWCYRNERFVLCGHTTPSGMFLGCARTQPVHRTCTTRLACSTIYAHVRSRWASMRVNALALTQCHKIRHATLFAIECARGPSEAQYASNACFGFGQGNVVNGRSLPPTTHAICLVRECVVVWNVK